MTTIQHEVGHQNVINTKYKASRMWHLCLDVLYKMLNFLALQQQLLEKLSASQLILCTVIESTALSMCKVPKFIIPDGRFMRICIHIVFGAKIINADNFYM